MSSNKTKGKAIRNQLTEIYGYEKYLGKIISIPNEDFIPSNQLNKELINAKHMALTAGIKTNNGDVAVAIITSIEDEDGNPTKQEQIKKGLIKPINIKNTTRKSAVNSKVLTKHIITNKPLNINDYELTEAQLDETQKMEPINKFFYHNNQRRLVSYNNRLDVIEYKTMKDK